jgi:hypothetical protein
MKTGSPKAKWFSGLLRNPKSLSLPRKRESRKAWKDWIPASAGMTTWKWVLNFNAPQLCYGVVYFSSIIGYPALFQASTPPKRALAFLYPMSMYLVA